MLNWAHIHLMLTHIPVIGVGIVVTLLLTARVRGSRELEWVSVQLFVALALLSIVVYLTGSPASHQMREMPGISPETIHIHSRAADFAFWSMEVLGALSLGALFKFRSAKAVSVPFAATLLALGFAVLGLMIWTANLGGRIRHPEIGASSPEGRHGRPPQKRTNELSFSTKLAKRPTRQTPADSSEY